ncbi:MAG: response regulator transcription factor [Bacteroidota bacterium]
MIKIAIADDQRLFLEGMRHIIDAFEGMELIIEAENGRILLEAFKTQVPDVLLLDVKMPEMDGEAVVKQLKIDYSEVKILMLSMYDEERLMTHLMRLGANGYLLKNDSPDIVKVAIQAVHQTGFYFNDRLSKAMLQQLQYKQMASSKSSIAHETQISPREQEVLVLICQELTTAEIAKRLFISIRTVEGHRKNLMEKIGAKNMAGLVKYAVRMGLVK